MLSLEVIVITAVRSDSYGLFSACKVTYSLPSKFAPAVTVSQEALDDAVHRPVPEQRIVTLAGDEGQASSCMDSVEESNSYAACVTLTLEIKPFFVLVTVMVAVREVLPGFSEGTAVNDELLLPDVFESVSQSASEEAVQSEEQETLTVCDALSASGDENVREDLSRPNINLS